MGDDRRSGEESSDNDVLEHGKGVFVKNDLVKKIWDGSARAM